MTSRDDRVEKVVRTTGAGELLLSRSLAPLDHCVAIAAAFDADAAPAPAAFATIPGGGGAAAEPLENATAAAAAPRPTEAIAVAVGEIGLGPDKLTAGRSVPVARTDGFAQGLSSGEPELLADGCGTMGGGAAGMEGGGGAAGIAMGGGGGAAGIGMGGCAAAIVDGANGVAFGTLAAGGGATTGIPWRVVVSHFGAASPGAGSSAEGADAGPEAFCWTNGNPPAAAGMPMLDGRMTPVGICESAPPPEGGGDLEESTAASVPRAKGIVAARGGLGGCGESGAGATTPMPAK